MVELNSILDCGVFRGESESHDELIFINLGVPVRMDYGCCLSDSHQLGKFSGTSENFA